MCNKTLVITMTRLIERNPNGSEIELDLENFSFVQLKTIIHQLSSKQIHSLKEAIEFLALNVDPFAPKQLPEVEKFLEKWQLSAQIKKSPFTFTSEILQILNLLEAHTKK